MRRKIFLITIIVSVIIYISRVTYINISSEGFRVETDTYSMGDSIYLDEFLYNMHSFKLLNKDELNNQYGIDTHDDSDKTVYILGEIEIKYIGNSDEIIAPVRYGTFESYSWKNGMDNKIFNELNDNNMVFSKDEIKNIFVISKAVTAQFSDSEWKNVNNRHYYFVLDTYPRKVQIKCQ